MNKKEREREREKEEFREAFRKWMYERMGLHKEYERSTKWMQAFKDKKMTLRREDIEQK